MPMAPCLVKKSRRWIAWAIAGATLFYVAYSAWIGLGEVAASLAAFAWALYLPALLLTLLAHLLLLQWLNNQLQSIAFFADDEDENSISVSLLRPETPRSSPAPTTS